ncbi:MAG TPA: hypothetical protein VG013_23255 [Gemmataceae bacterium]|jgi:hypothetical protein|nr:hypothetical protein [Gemmataceae bacterium]
MGKPNKSRRQQPVQKPVDAQKQAGKAAPRVSGWSSHLDSYREKTVLTFASEKDLEKAIDLLWTDDLRTLPHATPDGQSIVVPTEAVAHFSKAGLKFTAKGLASMSDLSADEIEKLRR